MLQPRPTISRPFLKTSIAAAVLASSLCVTGTAAAQPTPFESTIDAVEVKAGIWMLRPNSPVGNSTVVAVIDGPRAALLDFGMASTAPLLREWLEAHGVKEVSFAASSHHHPDHTNGLAKLAEWARPIFVTSRQQYDRLYPEADKPVAWPGLAAIRTQTLTVVGGETLHLGDHSIRIDVTASGRSHTDGDLLFSIDGGAVRYIGDHMFIDRYPVVDSGGGADLAGYLSTIDCVVKSSRADAVIIPGHALFSPTPLATASPARLAAWRARLIDSIQVVRGMRAAGQSPDEAQAKGLPPGFASLVEKPFFVGESKWIETVYRALDAKQDLGAGCDVPPTS